MRYEHLTLDLSTAACELLRKSIARGLGVVDEPAPSSVRGELVNFVNELDSRLQRRDPDPNAAPICGTEDWL